MHCKNVNGFNRRRAKVMWSRSQNAKYRSPDKNCAPRAKCRPINVRTPLNECEEQKKSLRSQFKIPSRIERFSVFRK